ncbi:MAG: 4-alpha-glucanotransferase [Verrucomicrobia bacterium]|nr:MAG: 4-alpha-glucanotransferase [Verrucomicrobiota bacterium]TAF25402.1 MAG: 4-alpha-glucanotransferase [Verrucomicrobiota bacterium]TAF41189.1 MAG: 4-alpha-glucanotransferase [Verrucomicrobiota bacterium]
MSIRLAGLLLPAFSPSREGDFGIGDTRSMRRWIDHCAEQGVGFLQLLPINETGSDDSPYNAISSVALEPLYLTCEAGEIPGLEASDVEEARRDFRECGLRVDYASSRRAKRGLLEKAWLRFQAGGGDPAFGDFRRSERGWLEDYCAYRWLMEKAGGSEVWDEWPEAWRSVSGARAFLAEELARERAAVAGRLDFHAWVQWLCFTQWKAVRAHAESRGVKLMGDVPIGVSRCSADVFFGRDDFDLDHTGGAPPETLFKHDRFIQRWGQNWGIPLYRWDRMEAAGFPWWRQRIAKLAEVFHIFRIDHVLGFYRIYSFPWQPRRNEEFLDLSDEEALVLAGGRLPRWSPRPDDSPAHCAANRFDGDVRLRMVLEAAGGAAVVAEDLGCVPDYVRPHLASLDIAGFRIPHWDVDEAGRVVPGDKLPECSFATYATHDHDSLPAMWADFRARSADPVVDEEERRKVTRDLALLAEFGGVEAEQDYGPTVKAELLAALFASRSRYAAFMITDLCDLTDRINSPGTVGPQNWSFRLSGNAEEIALRELGKLRAVLRATGRCSLMAESG